MSVIIEGLPGPILDPEIITIKGEVVPDAPTMFSAEDFQRIQAISRQPRAESGKAVHPSEELFAVFTELSTLLNATYPLTPDATIHAPTPTDSGIIVDRDVISLINSLHRAADSNSRAATDLNRQHRLPDREASSLHFAVGYTATLSLICHDYDTKQLNKEREDYISQLQATLAYIQNAERKVKNIYHSVQDMSIFEKGVLMDVLGLPSEDPQELHSITTRQYIKGRLLSGQSWTDVKDTVDSLKTPDAAQKDTAVQIFRDIVRATAQAEAEKDLQILTAIAALHPSKKDALDKLQEASEREIITLFDTYSPEEAAQRATSYFAEIMASAAKIVK